MSNINILKSPAFDSVRIVMIHGDPWFVAKDVATCLGYADPIEVLVQCLEDEKYILLGAQFREMQSLRALETIYIEQPERLPDLPELSNDPKGLAVISEAGFYYLVMRSHEPEAEDFRRWAMREVISFVRKFCSYIPGKSIKAWVDVK